MSADGTTMSSLVDSEESSEDDSGGVWIGVRTIHAIVVGDGVESKFVVNTNPSHFTLWSWMVVGKDWWSCGKSVWNWKSG